MLCRLYIVIMKDMETLSKEDFMGFALEEAFAYLMVFILFYVGFKVTKKIVKTIVYLVCLALLAIVLANTFGALNWF